MFWSIAIPSDTLKTLRDRLNIPDGVRIIFAYDWEDSSPEDGFCDPEAARWVREQIEQDNAAAWFLARVTVTDGDAEGIEYLGACSYESFNDFLTPADYFGDMVASAYDAFLADAERLALKYGRGK